MKPKPSKLKDSDKKDSERKLIHKKALKSLQRGLDDSVAGRTSKLDSSLLASDDKE